MKSSKLSEISYEMENFITKGYQIFFDKIEYFPDKKTFIISCIQYLDDKMKEIKKFKVVFQHVNKFEDTVDDYDKEALEEFNQGILIDAIIGVSNTKSNSGVYQIEITTGVRSLYLETTMWPKVQE